MNKKDYFNQVFNVTKRKLGRQSISSDEIEKFSKIFNVMLGGDDLFKQLYLMMQIKKLENFGKYLLFILKKLDDNVINSENIYGNIVYDSDHIEKEILEYLGVEITESLDETEEIIESKPKPLKEKLYIVDNKDADEEEDKTDETIKEFYRALEQNDEDNEGEAEIELIKEDDDEDDLKIINLELLDIERNPNPSEIDMVFELPSSVAENILHDNFIEHHDDYEDDNAESNKDEAKARVNEDEIEHVGTYEGSDDEPPVELSAAGKSEDVFEMPEDSAETENDNKEEVKLSGETQGEVHEEINDEISSEEHQSVDENIDAVNKEETAEITAEMKEPEGKSEDVSNDENILTELPKGIDEIFEEIDPREEAAENEAISAETSANKEEEKKNENEKSEDVSEEPQQSLEFDIPIEREISQRNEYADESKKDEASQETFIEREQEPEEANQEYLQYERTVMRVNAELFDDFAMMTEYAKKLNKDYAFRDQKIKDIISKTYMLEELSKELSFEVITNIYQTFRYSFEKISDGKYDISEDTLHLFTKGIELIGKLLKEDNVTGYDKQIKDLDKIRKALLIENKKKTELVQKKKEEEIIESSIQNKYPDHFQREIINKIRKKILDTEKVFNSINEVNSEFILYDRLRLLGDNLNNFKELVQFAKEINLDRLAKLSEGGYILIKYIQNYRIDPSNEEMKEIFGYISYNLKLLVLDKPAEDLDVFISYLYDPVKIFTEQEKHKQEQSNKNQEK